MAFCMNRGDYTYEKVLEGFGKEKAPFIIWREEDLFVLRPYPVKTKFWGFFFCVEGHMEIEINLRHRTDCVEKRRFPLYGYLVFGRILEESSASRLFFGAAIRTECYRTHGR